MTRPLETSFVPVNSTRSTRSIHTVCKRYGAVIFDQPSQIVKKKIVIELFS